MTTNVFEIAQEAINKFPGESTIKAMALFEKELRTELSNKLKSNTKLELAGEIEFYFHVSEANRFFNNNLEELN